MCHFLFLPYPHLCSGEGKRLRKYIASFKLEQNFILMIEEKAFADFIITGVIIILFSGTYAPVMCIPGSLGVGDSGDIAGPKCRDLTFDESRQCRRCTGVLISRQNANLCHILTTKGKLSLYICTV